MDWSQQRILLSGASGMVGSALHASLIASRAQLLQLVRREPASPHEIRWSPAHSTPPRLDALEGLSAAIHLSGANVAAHRWTKEYRGAIASSRVDSTHAVSRALAELANPPQTLLVASAVGIYGDRGDETLNESSAPGSGFLAGVCRAWEAAALPAVDAGIRVVHLRFGVVFAPGSGALAKMLPIFRLGLGGKLGSGRQWMSWIALDDVVAAVRFALETPALKGPVNFTAPNPVTNAEFTQTLARRLHRPAIFPAPAFALRLALGPMADETLLASARVLPTRLTQAGFAFAHPTLAGALATLLK